MSVCVVQKSTRTEQSAPVLAQQHRDNAATLSTDFDSETANMNALLYVAVVLIWGTTWIGITLQGQQAAPLTAIFWRFAIAAAVLLGGLVLTGRLQRLRWRDHGFCVLQSLCVFSLNFVCFYTAVRYINSGLESVIFSMAVFFNALNSWWFFGQKPHARFVPAACMGLLGIVLLFWHELDFSAWHAGQLWGIGLAMLGTYGFSLGNMLSVRHQQHGLDVFSTNAYAMLYGTLVLALLAYVFEVSLALPMSAAFVWPLLYLAVFGSVIGFTAYFTLVKRLGAAQSAYATLLFPLVALSISTVCEGYQWRWAAVVGMVLILVGNYLMFHRPKA